MILRLLKVFWTWTSDLHVCGDDPNDLMPASASLVVISTYVEMILHFRLPDRNRHGDLHVCGDDPPPRIFSNYNFRWSPRMWRWSYYALRVNKSKSVISTYVEMILFLCIVNCLVCSDLHVCGDDPTKTSFTEKEKGWSPRMWRWSWIWRKSCKKYSVISTYVEMIPT